MSSLVDRWFLQPFREEQEQTQAERDLVTQKHEFCTRPSYHLLHRRLDELSEENRPQPGDQESVNYHLGVWDGIDKVRKLLRGWEGEVRSQND